MVHELKIPQAGESIQEVQIGQWLREEGQWVDCDEVVVELETDKASMDLTAPVSGLLTTIFKTDGDAADVGDVIALIDDSADEPEVKTPVARSGPVARSSDHHACCSATVARARTARSRC